jgi:DNA-binding MarR family transcriptional regulator
MAAMFVQMRGQGENAVDAPDAAALGCTCRRLRRMARIVTQLYDEALSAHGLTIAQFGLLATIAEHRAKAGKDISIGALATTLDLDPTTLNRNLNTLQRDKLVEVRPDKHDRRVRAVALTPSGRQRLKNARPAWRAAQDDLERRLGRDDVAAMHDVLDRSRDRLVDGLRAASEDNERASQSASARA